MSNTHLHMRIEELEAENEKLKKIVSELTEAPRLNKNKILKDFIKSFRTFLDCTCNLVAEGNDIEGITDVGYMQEEVDEYLSEQYKKLTDSSDDTEGDAGA